MRIDLGLQGIKLGLQLQKGHAFFFYNRFIQTPHQILICDSYCLHFIVRSRNFQFCIQIFNACIFHLVFQCCQWPGKFACNKDHHTHGDHKTSHSHSKSNHQCIFHTCNNFCFFFQCHNTDSVIPGHFRCGSPHTGIGRNCYGIHFGYCRMFLDIAYQFIRQPLGPIQNMTTRKKCHYFDVTVRNLENIFQLLCCILNFNISKIASLNFSRQGKNFFAFPDPPSVHMRCHQNRFSMPPCRRIQPVNGGRISSFVGDLGTGIGTGRHIPELVKNNNSVKIAVDIIHGNSGIQGIQKLITFNGLAVGTASIILRKCFHGV